MAMKMTPLLLGKEFLLSRRLGSDATRAGCEPAEWPGKAFIKRSSGSEPVRSTPLNDSTPDKVLRDIGEDTITLHMQKRFLFYLFLKILKTNWQSWLIWIRQLVLYNCRFKQNFTNTCNNFLQERRRCYVHERAQCFLYWKKTCLWPIKWRIHLKKAGRKKQRKSEDCVVWWKFYFGYQ